MIPGPPEDAVAVAAFSLKPPQFSRLWTSLQDPASGPRAASCQEAGPLSTAERLSPGFARGSREQKFSLAVRLRLEVLGCTARADAHTPGDSEAPACVLPSGSWLQSLGSLGGRDAPKATRDTLVTTPLVLAGTAFLGTCHVPSHQSCQPLKPHSPGVQTPGL